MEQASARLRSWCVWLSPGKKARKCHASQENQLSRTELPKFMVLTNRGKASGAGFDTAMFE
jgi:hypothetical protein